MAYNIILIMPDNGSERGCACALKDSKPFDNMNIRENASLERKYRQSLPKIPRAGLRRRTRQFCPLATFTEVL